MIGTRLLWRGEPINDVDAFCRAKGFRIAIVEVRERHRNFPTNPEPWGPWSKWTREEWPEPMATSIMKFLGGARETQERIIDYRAPEGPNV